MIQRDSERIALIGWKSWGSTSLYPWKNQRIRRPTLLGHFTLFKVRSRIMLPGQAGQIWPKHTVDCINPILGGLWNYVTGRGGAIMARMDSSHPEAVSRHPKAQKWLPSNFVDLWLSIDTKNSTLWVVVLTNPAVKRPWWKMKIFMQKYVKIKIFLIHESYIHQKKA